MNEPTRTRRTYVTTDDFGRIVSKAQTPVDHAAERAARGATLLDREIPGWADHIDLDRLDVGEGEMRDDPGTDDSLGCILCQLDHGITQGQILAPRAAPVVGSGSDAASDRLDRYAEEERFYEAEGRRISDAIDEERADILDDHDGEPTGAYDRLALQLGLTWYDGLGRSGGDSAKVSHGFLTDGKTTYPALDEAWRSEILARRSSAPPSA